MAISDTIDQLDIEATLTRAAINSIRDQPSLVTLQTGGMAFVVGTTVRVAAMTELNQRLAEIERLVVHLRKSRR